MNNTEKIVVKKYRELLKSYHPELKVGEQRMVRKALKQMLNDEAADSKFAEKEFWLVNIEIAIIAAQEIGLRVASTITIFLSGLFQKNNNDTKKIEQSYGKQVQLLCKGISLVSKIEPTKKTIESEHFHKLIVNLAKDSRVLLIKLAEHIFLMRNLDNLNRTSQKRTVSESVYVYTPLAHRLGMYKIKLELEDISLRFSEPKTYKKIQRKLLESKDLREKYVDSFIKPLQEKLDNQNYEYRIKWRTKSIQSILNKMRTQNVGFEGVFDIFAVRIILTCPITHEKDCCWSIYSAISDIYQPNPRRLRDWITVPKSNGYESLHTTLLGPSNKWVEVQIRTERMDDIAENGVAAHWKYKGGKSEEVLENWISNIRAILTSAEYDSDELIDEFQSNIFQDEVYVFTPKGELKKYPAGATVLDFAFDIHSEVGATCTSARINNKLVPLRHRLKNGDEIKIITRKNQKPALDWLNFVVTPQARNKIKKYLNEEKYKVAQIGEEELKRKLKNWKVPSIDEAISYFIEHYKFSAPLDLYYEIGLEKIEIADLKKALKEKNNSENKENHSEHKKTESKEKKQVNPKDILIIDSPLDNVNYHFAKCCKPIPGDYVFGFVTVNKGITIHRYDCPNAETLLTHYSYRTMDIEWGNENENSDFEAFVRIKGLDELGIAQSITQLISSELKINMRSFSMSTDDGFFRANLKMVVQDKRHLNSLLSKLRKLPGIIKANRVTEEF